jgi:hypothetical protein
LIVKLQTMDVDKTTSAVILVQCDWSDALK